MSDVAAAYRYCAEVARASGTSFYYGMRLLPRARREALFAVYAFARLVDDIADGEQSPDASVAALARVRIALDDLQHASEDPVYVALADATRRFRIPRDALDDLVDGVEMDLDGVRFSTFDELVVYCRRVGGSIGRLAVAVFGSADPARASVLADTLGVAFQLTNVLRDVGEDLGRGRIYLPQEDLDEFECRLDEGPDDRFTALVRFEAARAETWFDDGLELLPMLDRPCAASVAAMAGTYRRLLRRIERDPHAVRFERVSLPAWEKGWVTARSLVGAGAPT